MSDTKQRRKGCLSCALITTAFILMGLALGIGMVLWEDYVGYTVLWRGYVEEKSEGIYTLEVGKTYTLALPLAASERERYLWIEPTAPCREFLRFRCVLSIEVQFADSHGNVVAEVSPNDLFEAYGFEFPRYARKQVAFQALNSGIYTLRVIPYSEEIRRVDFSIREKR